MLINLLDETQALLDKLDPRLNKWWPLSYEAALVLYQLQTRFGDPSRLYKYRDYCAVHYAFQQVDISLSGDRILTLTDFMWTFFPDEDSLNHFHVGVAKAAVGLVYDVKNLHLEPEYEERCPSTGKPLSALKGRRRDQKVSYELPTAPTLSSSTQNERLTYSITSSATSGDSWSLGDLYE